MKQLVFVILGISGVGKTTLCEQFCEDHPHFLHIRISKILIEAKNKIARTQENSNYNKNLADQKLIVAEFKKTKAEYDDKSFVVDAHCVLDTGKDYFYIPTDVFSEISPDHYFVLRGNAEQIFRQRDRDLRARPPRTVSELKHYQKIATDYAKFISIQTNKPITIINSSNYAFFENSLISISKSLS